MNKKPFLLACIIVSLCFINVSFTQPELKVMGIAGGKEPIALVDGIFVKEGEEVHGAQILKIGFDYVKFRYEDKVFIKEVGGKIRKQVKTIESIPDKVLVSFVTKKYCFIEVRIDGKLAFQDVLKEGIEQKWEGKERIEIKVSDGLAISLKANNADPLALQGGPRTLKITANSVTQ